MARVVGWGCDKVAHDVEGVEEWGGMTEELRGPRSRTMGAIYLLYFLTAIFSELCLRGLSVTGAGVFTAGNVEAHAPLYQAGLGAGLLATACYLALTALFYGLFKAVNRSVSLIAALMSVVGCAVQAFGSVFRLAPLAVWAGGKQGSALTVEQWRSLAVLFLRLHAQATHIALVFFGLYCVLIGYLIFRSAFLPRVLAGLMALAGLGWLTSLYPPLAGFLTPYREVVGFVAEASLMGWLLVKGVKMS